MLPGLPSDSHQLAIVGRLEGDRGTARPTSIALPVEGSNHGSARIEHFEPHLEVTDSRSLRRRDLSVWLLSETALAIDAQPHLVRVPEWVPRIPDDLNTTTAVRTARRAGTVGRRGDEERKPDSQHQTTPPPHSHRPMLLGGVKPVFGVGGGAPALPARPMDPAWA